MVRAMATTVEHAAPLNKLSQVRAMATAEEHAAPLNKLSQAQSAGVGAGAHAPAGKDGLDAGGKSQGEVEKEVEVPEAQFKVGNLPLSFSKNCLFVAKIIKTRYSFRRPASWTPSLLFLPTLLATLHL
jgi:hypothetical protein